MNMNRLDGLNTFNTTLTLHLFSTHLTLHIYIFPSHTIKKRMYRKVIKLKNKVYISCLSPVKYLAQNNCYFKN